MEDRTPRPDRSRAALPAFALGAGLLITAPAMAPGFVLVGDMVFVPRQYLGADAFGLGSALPRAVPADAVIGLVTAVVPGSLVQKAVLLATVVAAVLGAARLVPRSADGRHGLAAVVAGLVYGWSPYLAERLLMGHWALLAGYAALPWVARAALGLRAGQPRALARLVLAMAPAALTPTGSLLAGGVAVALGGRARLPRTAGVTLVLALPWLVAGLAHPGTATSDPAGVAAFAARAEGWAPAVVSVLGGGGIWNAQAVPASRSSPLVPLVTLLLVGLACLGWPRLVAAWGRGPATALGVLGACGVLAACAGAVPGLDGLLADAVRTVPGAGLLRDGQKWAAWWMPAMATGAGLGAARLVALVAPGRGGRAGRPGAGATATAVAVLLVALPLVAVPDLAWGVGGRLEPVGYPRDWERVRAALAAPEPGAVLVLPFGAVRAFGWNAGRPQLDPAPRYLPRPVVVDDTLVVGGVAVAGEDERARRAGAAAGDPAAMAALGIGYVLVEHGTPGPAVPPAVAALPLVVDGHWLQLRRVPGAAGPPGPGPARTVAVVGAHVVALSAVALAALCLLASRITVSPRRARGRWGLP